jgi:hypothetical protein
MTKRQKQLTLEYFRQQGAKGGRAAAKGSTPAERSARALKASKAAAVARSKKKRAKDAKG